MALQDKVPLSIVDLNSDCLFKIFSYLKLSEILNFRSQCSDLNYVVLKYLFSVTKISILYTENEDPEERISLIPNLRVQSPSKTIRSFLDETFEFCTPNPHFRSGDFMIVSCGQKYANFLRFIKKYLPNIKKLVLIIDPNAAEYTVLLSVTELLKACPKAETLFLERTSRGMNKRSTMHNWTFNVNDLGRLLVTIAGLASLSELHFFAYRTSSINFAGLNETMETTFEDLAETMIGHFLLAMFNKLRIFHINNFLFENVHRFYLAPLLGRTLENILELGFEAVDCMQLTNSGTVSKNLHSLTIFGCNFGRFDAYSIGDSFPQLKTLHFDSTLRLTDVVMHNLNALPNLEKLTAEVILHDLEVYENATIKHIQVENVDRQSKYTHKYAFDDFFQGLLTVTVLKPEVVVYDRNSFNDIHITYR